MAFIAYQVSLEAVRLLKPIIAAVRRHDAKLAEQLRESGSSAPLNLAEGRRRRGGDRTYHYRVAAGSTAEARATIDVAEALGYLDGQAAEAAAAWAALDRVLALTWPLVK
jgi:four helix bundle protein